MGKIKRHHVFKRIERPSIMRIGIDAHVLGKNIGGVERFVRELVSELPTLTPQHQYTVFVTRAMFAALKESNTAQVQYVALALSNPLVERLIVLPWLVQQHKLDALLVQRLSPWFCGKCKLIVTIHDLTPIKFSSTYKGLSNKLVRLLTKNTIKRAALILTPTLAIKAEIQQYCKQVTAPIHAFYNGVDVSAFYPIVAKNKAVKSAYLLTVGAIESRKNLETILDALPLLHNHPYMQLVVVGKVRDQVYFDMLKEKISDLNLSSRVTWQGFMVENDLIHLYQQAAVFITSSKDEGFNIPPLEAMACGKPVVCSDIAVHQELFTGAALFFKTTSAQDLAQKVQFVLDNAEVANDLSRQGLKKVAEFTWQRTAKNVAAAIAEIA
jgi:glycosyltransferase involved in cell wall biosynthesis